MKNVNYNKLLILLSFFAFVGCSTPRRKVNFDSQRNIATEKNQDKYRSTFYNDIQFNEISEEVSNSLNPKKKKSN